MKSAPLFRLSIIDDHQIILLGHEEGEEMIPRHDKMSDQQYLFVPGAGVLLQRLRHRTIISLVLLGAALVLGATSFFTDSLFPLLSLLGIPSAQLCLTFAFVLGISGVVTSIIGMIERIDRSWSQAAMFQRSKEHSYANRN